LTHQLTVTTRFELVLSSPTPGRSSHRCTAARRFCPYVAEMATEQILKPGYDFGKEFEFRPNVISAPSPGRAGHSGDHSTSPPTAQSVR
jgi:hypothetical protein